MGKKHSNAKNIAIGGAVAAVAGYVAGVLTAPKSGKETRADIKDTAERTMTEAEKDLKRLHTDLDNIIKEAKTRGGKLSSRAQKELDKLVAGAKDTNQKAREMLSALHEGDANDKDLAKAIKDANKALEHLRDYLKK